MKKWKRPKLIVLVRKTGQLTLNVPVVCKYVGDQVGPLSMNLGCYNMQETCGVCSNFGASGM